MLASIDAGSPLCRSVAEPLALFVFASFRLMDFFNFACNFSITSLHYHKITGVRVIFIVWYWLTIIL